MMGEFIFQTVGPQKELANQFAIQASLHGSTQIYRSTTKPGCGAEMTCGTVDGTKYVHLVLTYIDLFFHPILIHPPQVLDVLPPFVEIVTWNDYGESHYVGPIYEAGIPPGADVYVDNRPHTAWLETLPYQIAAYKNAYDSSNPASEVAAGDDKIVAWYRTSPASAGTTEATGNYCKSAINIYGYQTCYPVDQIEQDGIFAIILASASGSASISIGDGDATSFDDIQAGINFISAPFGGLAGAVTVTFGDIILNGEDITAEPADGVANFNAWTGCAGACAGSADT